MTTTLPVPPTDTPDLPPPPARHRSRVGRFFLGPVSDAPWVRPALIALLLVTGVLYLWGLNKNGWANAFYSAAVQAGSENWKAFFFGSSDAANSITVDKTPAAAEGPAYPSEGRATSSSSRHSTGRRICTSVTFGVAPVSPLCRSCAPAVNRAPPDA